MKKYRIISALFVITVVAGIIIILILFDRYPMKPDPDKIIFSLESDSWAWGHKQYAMVVMGDGRVYIFSYQLNGYKPKNLAEDYVNEKMKYIDQIEPYAILDEEYLLDMYNLAFHIDEKAEINSEFFAYDASQYRLYFHKPDGTKVMVDGMGAIKEIVDDQNAQKLKDKFMNIENYYIMNGNYENLSLFVSDLPLLSFYCKIPSCITEENTFLYFDSYWEDFRKFTINGIN